MGVLLIGNKGGIGSRYSSCDECIGRMFARKISSFFFQKYLIEEKNDLAQRAQKMLDPIIYYNQSMQFLSNFLQKAALVSLPASIDFTSMQLAIWPISDYIENTLNAQCANIFLKNELFPFNLPNNPSNKALSSSQSNNPVNVIIGFVKKFGMESFNETKLMMEPKSSNCGIVGRAIIDGLPTKLNSYPSRSIYFK